MPTITLSYLQLSVDQYGQLSKWPAARTPRQDQEHIPEHIPIPITVEGTWISSVLFGYPIIIEFGLDLNGVPGLAISADPIIITVTFYGLDDFEIIKNGWVKWSKIGSLDFTIDEGNLAGERPLGWSGVVYGILKLEKKVIAYGAGGVSLLAPSGVFYGLDNIHNTGLISRYAFAGSNTIHFFVDALGVLYQIDSKLHKLGYTEYLIPMTNLNMYYDNVNSLLYLCDGVIGYVYNHATRSLGSGPIDLTGLGYYKGDYYTTSSTTPLTQQPFEICSDIYDFGTRKFKTLKIVEVGTNTSEDLYVAVDYRINYEQNFIQTDWFLVNPNGRAYPKCYGVEFRVRLKTNNYAQLELDYLRLHAFIHGFIDSTGAPGLSKFSDGNLLN